MGIKRILTVISAALAMTAVLFSCSRPQGAAEKTTIAIAALPEATLANVAAARDFFREEGLDATTHLFPYGKIALQQLLGGKADFATVAETPVMFAIMRGEKISVIATIVTTKSGHVIVARKDRGIVNIGDLKGKTIGTTMGTSAQFFLDAILLAKGVPRGDISIVDMPAEKLPGALARGEVDAISAFTPYTLLAEDQLHDNAVVFADKDIYRYTFNVVAKQDFIRNNPRKVQKVLRALVKAEKFLQSDPAEAQKIVGKVTGLQMDVLRRIWDDSDFSVSLDQTLILALEDESDWAIKNRLSTATKVPNYLPYIYLEGLQSIRPDAVRILK